MLDIEIIAIGKIKEKNYQKLTEKFISRLQPYAKIKMVELKNCSFYNDAHAKTCLKKESQKILKTIKKYPDAFIVILDEKGENFSSLDFAKFLKSKNQKIIFFIGGALGLTAKVKNSADLKLSLSQMTFPHEMSRVILLEQIYRAITILMQKKYHY